MSRKRSRLKKSKKGKKVKWTEREDYIHPEVDVPIPL